jgi:hypothetical protein
VETRVERVKSLQIAAIDRGGHVLKSSLSARGDAAMLATPPGST